MLQLNPDLDKEKQEAIFKKLQAEATQDQDHAAWLQARKGRITASSAWKLITPNFKPANNATRQSYILEKVAERLGSNLEQFSTAAMTWGTENEAEAIAEYEKQTGKKVLKKQEVEGLETLGKYAGATPDGYVNRWGIVEAKCPYNPAVHIQHIRLKDENEMKQVLFKYYTQIQFQLLVCKKKWADFISYDPRTSDKYKLKIIRVNRDFKITDMLHSEIKRADKEIKEIIKEINGHLPS